MSENKIWNRTSNIVLSGAVAGLLVLGYLHVTEPERLNPPPTQQTGQVTDPGATAAQVTPGGGTATEDQVINLYKNNSDSVVNVTTRSFQYNYFMELVPRDGAGSGFVIDKSGHVVTNYHVVQGAQRFFVAFGNREQSYPAQLVGFDQSNDLAVLKVDAPANLLKPVQLGDSDKLQVGQTAVAIGNPFGLGQTITTGVVSSLNRDIQAENNRVMSGLIQTDAAINRGNSGGPLFDSRGRVIGVNTMIYSPSGGSVGIGFAIPINTVKHFIPDLIQYGRVRHPWLGVSVLALNPRLAQVLKMPVSEGLLVVQVAPGGSAQKAGVSGGNRRVYVGNYELYLGGDVLLAVDGKSLRQEQDLLNYLQSNKKLGDTLELTLLKGGQGQPVKLNIPLDTARN
ncbi:MAG: trypsin-like peptidase domain-containing protein [Candidatus Sericytochromatia bacterium]|nr:trypsin-like peptidase domain-containing protein [Candidatus Sericytochromatia bacterium]